MTSEVLQDYLHTLHTLDMSQTAYVILVDIKLVDLFTLL